MKTTSPPVPLHLASKMRRPETPAPRRVKHRTRSLTSVISFGVLFIILAAATLLPTSSATSRLASRGGHPSSAPSSSPHTPDKGVVNGKSEKKELPAPARGLRAPGGLFPAAAFQLLGDEGIATYAADCTTAKVNFNLGEWVCAKAVNAPLRGSGEPALRRINWAGTRNTVRQAQDVLADPQTNLFQLPTDATTDIDGETVDNRGVWTASLNATSDGSTRAVAYFNVSDPDNARADLAIYNSSTSSASPVSPGQAVSFQVWVVNLGPDTADSVHVTMADPAGMTFDSAEQTAGPSPGFTCSNSSATTDCSISPNSTLPGGARAIITFTFNVNSAQSDLDVTSLAQVSSSTVDPRPRNNDSAARVSISAGQAASADCTLTCPGNMIVSAYTSQVVGGVDVRGAFVKLAGNVESSGECGAVTTSPAETDSDTGTFFPVGSPHTVTASSASGDTCSYTITVVEPFITCPADITNAVAPAGQLEAEVTVGEPTVNATDLLVTGTRSDNRALADPYPVGTTVITWTARDIPEDPSDPSPPLVSSSCRQTIIVGSSDAPTIACPGDKTFTSSSCDSGAQLSSGQLGSPVTTGTEVEVTALRSDRKHLTDDPYPVGTTVITWTATDNIGRSVSCEQEITVNPGSGSDVTGPVINVPPDVEAFTSSCSALVDDELGVATATDDCGGRVKVTRTGVPTRTVIIFGRPITRETFIFPVGTTIVTYTATDPSGNTTVATQRVTVKEKASTPPTIIAPNDVTLFTAADSCGVTVGNLDATLGTATAADNCGGGPNGTNLTVARSGVPAGNVFPRGVTLVSYTATDASGNTSAPVTQRVTVVDDKKPTLNAPDIVVPNDPGSCSAVVNFTGLTASDNCGTANINTSIASGSVFQKGTTQVTATATDAAGNTTTKTFNVTVNDTEAPVVNVPANIAVYLPLNSTATSMQVNYNVTFSDNCGIQTSGVSPASGAVFPVGPTTVTATATDTSGNATTRTFTVTVLYNFTGFFSPVNNPQTLNVVNAGRAIPVKFSLSGNKGLSIFAAGSPSSAPFTCGNSSSVDLTETVDAASNSINYDASADQYNFIWKTEGGWAGQCRTLSVTLNDGTTHTALFKFR